MRGAIFITARIPDCICGFKYMHMKSKKMSQRDHIIGSILSEIKCTQRQITYKHREGVKRGGGQYLFYCKIVFQWKSKKSMNGM